MSGSKELSGSAKRRNSAAAARWAVALTMAGARLCEVRLKTVQGKRPQLTVLRPALGAPTEAGDEVSDEEGREVGYEAVQASFPADVREYFDAEAAKVSALQQEAAAAKKEQQAAAKRKSDKERALKYRVAAGQQAGRSRRAQAVRVQREAERTAHRDFVTGVL